MRAQLVRKPETTQEPSPVANEEQSFGTQLETPLLPDIATQMQRADTFGHRFQHLPIQPKLVVGQPNDQWEQEADQMAERAMTLEANPTPVQRLPQEELGVQREMDELPMPDPPAMSVPNVGNAEAGQAPPAEMANGLPGMAGLGNPQDMMEGLTGQDAGQGLMGLAGGAAPGGTGGTEGNQNNSQDKATEQTPPDLEAQIQQAMTQGGQSLPGEMQEKLRQRLGMVNPEDIQIHDDPVAHELCQTLGARAFTTREHIFFAEGAYEPNTPTGQALIFHEAVHTMQQGATQSGSEAPPEAATQEEGDGFMTPKEPGAAQMMLIQRFTTYDQQASAYDAAQQAANAGNTNTTPTPTPPEEISRDELIGKAFAQGAIEGAITGAATSAIAVGLSAGMGAIAKFAPKVAGGIGGALTLATSIWSLASDPKGFAEDTFVKPFTGQFKEGGTLYDSVTGPLTGPWDFCARVVEFMLGIIEFVNGILKLISFILTLIASILTVIGYIMLILGIALSALGTALSPIPIVGQIIGPPLISAGGILQGNSSVPISWGSTLFAWEKPIGILSLQLTLYTLILRPFAIMFRALDLRFGNADPETLVKKQAKLQKHVSSFISDGASAATKIGLDSYKAKSPNKAKQDAAKMEKGEKANAGKSLKEDYFGKSADKKSTLGALLDPRSGFKAFSAGKDAGGAFGKISSFNKGNNFGFGKVKDIKAAESGYKAGNATRDKIKSRDKDIMSSVNKGDLDETRTKLRYYNQQGMGKDYGVSKGDITSAKLYGDIVGGADRKGTGIGKNIVDAIFYEKDASGKKKFKTVKVNDIKYDKDKKIVTKGGKEATIASPTDKEVYYGNGGWWKDFAAKFSKASDPEQEKDNEEERKKSEEEQKKVEAEQKDENEGKSGESEDEAKKKNEEEGGDEAQNKKPPEDEKKATEEGGGESAEAEESTVGGEVSGGMEDTDAQEATEEEFVDQDLDPTQYEGLYWPATNEEYFGSGEETSGESPPEDVSDEEENPMAFAIQQRLIQLAAELPPPPEEAVATIDATAYGLQALDEEENDVKGLQADNTKVREEAAESAATHKLMINSSQGMQGLVGIQDAELDEKQQHQAALKEESAAAEGPSAQVAGMSQDMQGQLENNRSNIDTGMEKGSEEAAAGQEEVAENQEKNENTQGAAPTGGTQDPAATTDQAAKQSNPQAAQDGMKDSSGQTKAFVQNTKESGQFADQWQAQTGQLQAQNAELTDQLTQFSSEHQEQQLVAEEEEAAALDRDAELAQAALDVETSRDALTSAREAAIAEIGDWIITSQSIQQAAYADIDAMVEGAEAAGLAEEEPGEDTAETDEELSDTDLDSEEVADELEGVADTVEMAVAGDAPPPEETDVDAAIDELKNTGGESLPAEVQQQLFQLYGIRDSDKIVIHDDAASYALCENLAAHAATNEEHIFFGEGRYNLDTDEGLQLIYHEVMHTLQHGGTEATEEGMVTDDTLFDLAAHLPGADLAGEDMSAAKMPGFDFTGANLSRVNFKDADLSKALLQDVNLEGADLTGVNLTEADLTGADLTNANLKNADLTKAKLDGAKLDGALMPS